MKLDTETDRKILIETMRAATVQGGFAAQFADLMQRVAVAEIETKPKAQMPELQAS
jgi:hypothetical protein